MRWWSSERVPHYLNTTGWKSSYKTVLNILIKMLVQDNCILFTRQVLFRCSTTDTLRKERFCHVCKVCFDFTRQPKYLFKVQCTLFTQRRSVDEVWARLGQREKKKLALDKRCYNACPCIFYLLFEVQMDERMNRLITKPYDHWVKWSCWHIYWGIYYYNYFSFITWKKTTTVGWK